mmetsp:Transcript_7929/g.11822  ORF Transcript_7929/g.11822 Transcript_7929/m.11822 type:complete len:1126 (-) Transcript_7929:770-4147(-)|eukprot:CAMPEP_0185042880 /NCGR_PEP_ID=MMETSP1103-20130426/42601_1 /TAXON_ID=36769 /ORGANISM="Paraphysomonas bandaiensis, Strain Caron Lab Isolate" /LENGTH=1125 /DNA_ID=CAMNT_0027583011 /DNA_START=81 /DNA_END=3458 /DNA_ORIENTATION=-
MSEDMKNDMDFLQMKDALTAVVACSVTGSIIRTAFVRVCNITDVPVVITRAELMADIKRDFRFVKGPQYVKPLQHSVDDGTDASGNPYKRDMYPSPFLRDYKATQFNELKKHVQPKLWTFNAVRVIDVAGQMAPKGDKGLQELVSHLAGCPVEILSLSNNNITDVGLKHFAPVFRSLKCLHTLHLTHNKFTDEGMEALFHIDNFSPTLRVLNVAFNELGKGSAWVLGRMFEKSRAALLEELWIGGQTHYRYTVNKFFLNFVPHLLYPGARPLKRLDVSSAGLNQEGLTALIALIVSSKDLEHVNVSRTPIDPTPLRYAFISALMANTSLKCIVLRYCGFRHREMMELEGMVASRRVSYLPPELKKTVEESEVKNMKLGSRLHTMTWRDKLTFIRLIVDARIRLENMRRREEEYFTEVKYIPPPVPRPTMPTRSEEVVKGCGVTNVQKLSKFLDKEEMKHSNIQSIASRARSSSLQAKKLPPIKERFKYPRSVYNSVESTLSSPDTLQSIEQDDDDSVLSMGAKSDVSSATSLVNASLSELTSLQKILRQSPGFLPAPTVQYILTVLKQAVNLQGMFVHIEALQNTLACPLVKEDVMFTAAEKYREHCDEDAFRDIMHVVDATLFVPGQQQACSLLEYAIYWKRSISKLQKRIANQERELIEVFNRWNELYDIRQMSMVMQLESDETLRYEDASLPPPSEEEDTIVTITEMTLEDLLSTQDELSESMEKLIACLVCMENTFTDGWKKRFAMRDVVYNPLCTISTTRKLGILWPTFNLASHYAAYVYLLNEYRKRVLAGEGFGGIITRVNSVISELPKKKIFRPRKGARFSLRVFSRKEPEQPRKHNVQKEFVVVIGGESDPSELSMEKKHSSEDEDPEIYYRSHNSVNNSASHRRTLFSPKFSESGVVLPQIPSATVSRRSAFTKNSGRSGRVDQNIKDTPECEPDAPTNLSIMPPARQDTLGEKPLKPTADDENETDGDVSGVQDDSDNRRLPSPGVIEKSRTRGRTRKKTKKLNVYNNTIRSPDVQSMTPAERKKKRKKRHPVIPPRVEADMTEEIAVGAPVVEAESLEENNDEQDEIPEEVDEFAGLSDLARKRKMKRRETKALAEALRARNSVQSQISTSAI